MSSYQLPKNLSTITLTALICSVLMLISPILSFLREKSATCNEIHQSTTNLDDHIAGIEHVELISPIRFIPSEIIAHPVTDHDVKATIQISVPVTQTVEAVKKPQVPMTEEDKHGIGHFTSNETKPVQSAPPRMKKSKVRPSKKTLQSSKARKEQSDDDDEHSIDESDNHVESPVMHIPKPQPSTTTTTKKSSESTTRSSVSESRIEPKKKDRSVAQIVATIPLYQAHLVNSILGESPAEQAVKKVATGLIDGVDNIVEGAESHIKKGFRAFSSWIDS